MFPVDSSLNGAATAGSCLAKSCSGVYVLIREAFLLVFISVAIGWAQEGPDSARLEITGSYWPVHTSGSIRANGTPVDLQSDLGVSQNTASFTGRLDLKLGSRSRIRLEGTPFDLNGSMNLNQSITYEGRTFSISDHIASTADLNYFYGGYEFDVVSRPAGHIGIEAGGAYLSADGTIASQVTGVTASKSETVGMPLAGAAFRAFPVHGKIDVELNGEVKGMDFGGYGYYVQATANAGIGKGFFLVEGGYRIVDANIRRTNGVDAVNPEFRGPVVSLVFRLH